MGLLHRFGQKEPAASTAAAPMKQSLPPMPSVTDEYQQRIRAQMEQELDQQRTRMQPHD